MAAMVRLCVLAEHPLSVEEACKMISRQESEDPEDEYHMSRRQGYFWLSKGVDKLMTWTEGQVPASVMEWRRGSLKRSKEGGGD